MPAPVGPQQTIRHVHVVWVEWREPGGKKCGQPDCHQDNNEKHRGSIATKTLQHRPPICFGGMTFVKVGFCNHLISFVSTSANTRIKKELKNVDQEIRKNKYCREKKNRTLQERDVSQHDCPP